MPTKAELEERLEAAEARLAELTGTLPLKDKLVVMTSVEAFNAAVIMAAAECGKGAVPVSDEDALLTIEGLGDEEVADLVLQQMLYVPTESVSIAETEILAETRHGSLEANQYGKFHGFEEREDDSLHGKIDNLTERP